MPVAASGQLKHKSKYGPWRWQPLRRLGTTKSPARWQSRRGKDERYSVSFKYTSAAWAVKDIPASPRLTLLCLADFANDAGECWPSQDTLADRTGHSTRTVRHNLAFLEQRSLITRRARSTQAKRLSDVITLQLQPAAIAVCATGNKAHVAKSSSQPAENAPQPAGVAENPVIEPVSDPVNDGPLSEKEALGIILEICAGY